MIGKVFLIYNTRAKVVNYDDVSGKYIYRILVDGRCGYASKDYILENEVI